MQNVKDEERIHQRSADRNQLDSPEDWYETASTIYIVDVGDVALAAGLYWDDLLYDARETESELEQCHSYLNEFDNEFYSMVNNAWLKTLLGWSRYCLRVVDANSAKVAANNAKYRFIEELEVNTIHMYYLLHPSVPEKTLERADCGMKEYETKDGSRVTSFEYEDFSELCGLSKTEIPISENSWVMVVDSYYADTNEDGYLDVVISYLIDGQYSAPADSYKVTLTSKALGEIEIVR